jgi:hypothetical protein
MKECLKAKINELETNRNINNIRDLNRGINDFKRGYQPRTNIVKDEKGDLFRDHHSILAGWRKHLPHPPMYKGLVTLSRQTYIQ